MKTKAETVTSPANYSWIVGGDRRVEIHTNGLLSIVQTDRMSYAVVDDECQQIYGICSSRGHAQLVFGRVWAEIEAGFYWRYAPTERAALSTRGGAA